jgi:hypothetical protein
VESGIAQGGETGSRLAQTRGMTMGTEWGCTGSESALAGTASDRTGELAHTASWGWSGNLDEALVGMDDPIQPGKWLGTPGCSKSTRWVDMLGIQASSMVGRSPRSGCNECTLVHMD